jgi:hypothetical protein
MTYRGTIKNGGVVLEPGVKLPEGTEVIVTAVNTSGEEVSAPGAQSVWQKLLELEGSAQGLPADLPERHDHYRRQRLKP